MRMVYAYLQRPRRGASLYAPLCPKLQNIELACAHTFGSSDINHIGGCRHLRFRLQRALPEKVLKLTPYRTVEGSQVIQDPYIICMVAEPAVNNDHGTKIIGH